MPAQFDPHNTPGREAPTGINLPNPPALPGSDPTRVPAPAPADWPTVANLQKAIAGVLQIVADNPARAQEWLTFILSKLNQTSV